eukprot:TRINITY_DN26361_c0_g1_i1.p1 TRINITY_DN26361_c0_g1~~TRINITY_DN26361_c0_g1_i1.p1  ORF type:complete len:1159 (-),score=154.66 TRINITY_DN26361_c0_g1_i1:48-3524(-)
MELDYDAEFNNLRVGLCESRDAIRKACDEEFARHLTRLDELRDAVKHLSSRDAALPSRKSPEPPEPTDVSEGSMRGVMLAFGEDVADTPANSQDLSGLPPALQKRLRAKREPDDIAGHRKGAGKKQSLVAAMGAEPVFNAMWREVFLTREKHMWNKEFSGTRMSEDRESMVHACTKVRSQSARMLSGLPVNRICLHPYSPMRVVWDVLGCLWILFDIIVIPLQIAFVPAAESAFSYYALILAFVYWMGDMCLSFCTAYVMDDGTIVYDHWSIARRYVRSWFPLDACIMSIDFVFLVLPSSSMLQMFRGLRAIRALRLARVVKMSKVSQVLSDLLTSLGVQWLTLVCAITKTMVSIVLLTHCVACAWHLLRSSNTLSRPSEVSETSFTSYTRSTYWVLGHLIAAPVDATEAPQNNSERTFVVVLVFLSLLVLGSAISKMTNTIAELNRHNEEMQNVRIKLQRYLRAANASNELAARILRFAQNSMRHRSVMTLDFSLLDLLSHNLKLELSVLQRRDHLCIHPLFQIICEDYEGSFAEICGALIHKVFASRDAVFVAGGMADFCYLTARGSYEIEINKRYIFEKPTCFAELCLYADVDHTSTLRARTFADAHALSGKALSQCIQNSPGCIKLVKSYACRLLSNYWEGDVAPPGKRVVDDVVPIHVAERVCQSIEFEDATIQTAQVDGYAFVHAKECATGASLQLFRGALSDDEVMDLLPQVFLEVSSDHGVYQKLEHGDEMKRCLCAMSCVYCLIHNRYDSFTQAQPSHLRLSKDTWNELQVFVRWVGLSEKEYFAMMVFLAIRGLGKIRAVANAVPPQCDSPEAIVSHLMNHVQHLVPSVALLDEEMVTFISSILGINESFHFAQMLQAENTPSQVLELQKLIRNDGDQQLKFYLLGLVAVMCALGGARIQVGSTFMTEPNAKNVLSAINYLQRLSSLSPHAIYWGFLETRAATFRLRFQTVEDLAITRVAALIRASADDAKELCSVWNALLEAERCILVDHFVADGITEKAFMFTFLPMFFANCRSNVCLNLKDAFTVMIDFIEILREQNLHQQTDAMTLSVDVRELADVALEVKSASFFQGVLHHIDLHFNDSLVKVHVLSSYRERAKHEKWMSDQTSHLSAVVGKIHRTMRSTRSTASQVSTWGPIERRERSSWLV